MRYEHTAAKLGFRVPWDAWPQFRHWSEGLAEAIRLHYVAVSMGIELS